MKVFLHYRGSEFDVGFRRHSIIQLKTKGSGILVSDFIDQHNGYLKLTNAEFVAAKQADQHAVQSAQFLLEYGVKREA